MNSQIIKKYEFYFSSQKSNFESIMVTNFENCKVIHWVFDISWWWILFLYFFQNRCLHFNTFIIDETILRILLTGLSIEIKMSDSNSKTVIHIIRKQSPWKFFNNNIINRFTNSLRIRSSSVEFGLPRMHKVKNLKPNCLKSWINDSYCTVKSKIVSDQVIANLSDWNLLHL
jgi:hypothetical protein